MLAEDVVQGTRRGRLEAVAARFGVHPSVRVSHATHIMEPLLTGEVPVGRWATVTINREEHLVEVCEDLDEAKAAAVRHAGRDAVGPQYPVCLVDLDTGAFLHPAWQQLIWVEQA